MADIFTNARKPFYSSTAFITLNKIPLEKYKAFIVHLFNQKNRNIQPEATNFILEWTRRHTFYTQQLCHTIYDNGATNIGLDDVKNACAQLLQQGEAVYLQYRQMLTEKQWRFLIAIAKEGSLANRGNRLLTIGCGNVDNARCLALVYYLVSLATVDKIKDKSRLIITDEIHRRRGI